MLCPHCRESGFELSCHAPLKCGARRFKSICGVLSTDVCVLLPFGRADHNGRSIDGVRGWCGHLCILPSLLVVFVLCLSGGGVGLFSIIHSFHFIPFFLGFTTETHK